jgi:hypothetical protein
MRSARGSGLLTYGYFRLSQSGRDVQIPRDHNVAKVMSILNAPHCQPVDVVDSEIAGELDFNIFALVAFERLQTVDTRFVGLEMSLSWVETGKISLVSKHSRPTIDVTPNRLFIDRRPSTMCDTPLKGFYILELSY